LRDNIRLLFALLGPLVMLLAMESSRSFDIKPLNFTVLDHDNSSESRKLIEAFSGSPYFIRQDNIYSIDEINLSLQTGKVKLVLEIPSDFGRDL
ncbi:ABC transporter permease, partial [Mannheimia haemolytica]|uniref:ABC transporter permease n=1 Tax=Mannheimia haemolytica TaxID=75985 RepID=UPI00115EBCA1